MVPTTSKSEALIFFLKSLRDKIVASFESLEKGACFTRKEWEHHTGGGGEISLMRGEVFEKAAVNWSAVSGPCFPTDDGEGPFFATGVSLVTHMRNPHAPTVHMNVRYIETEKRSWLGGGYDLTPMGLPYEEDTAHFHSVAKDTLDVHDTALYPAFARNAKEYFMIPHRGKERGVGGIFFDHFSTGDWEKDRAMWQDVGERFLETILPIYRKRVGQPYTEEERERQLVFRAHYAEFNLLYDRGTRFGFRSGGNPEAILCSMPPLAKW